MENKETTELEVTVRTTDPETGEFLDCNEYTLTVTPDEMMKVLDKGVGELFPLLFSQYPEDFPEEEPGVDAEIIDWVIVLDKAG